MHSTSMATSDDIKTVRQRRGESQEAFAEHFGVDQSTVHRWETLGPPARGVAAVGIDRILADLRPNPQSSPPEAAP